MLKEAVCKEICYKIENGNIRLKQNHNYYYQIQGQLNIAKRSFCDFIIYSDNDFHVERIYRDEVFWKNVMVDKLTTFYKNCYLPEIIDGRIPRGMKARD